MAVASIPSYKSPLIADLFAAHSFEPGVLPNLATMEDPSVGFRPTRLAGGAEVLFIARPEGLGDELAPTLSPLWENGLGMILFRHVEKQIFGAIFLHGAIRNEWNAIQSGAYQCLGGIMLFSDDPRENKSEVLLLADVTRKSTAMTIKFQFADGNLTAIGHPILTNLGGGKSTASHAAGEKGRKDAVTVTASVARELGIYISGSDQNMTGALCTFFAEQAPFNFMGAKDHIFPKYGGMADPSPWTARGVYEALKTTRRLHLEGRKVPIFFQGYGNVGAPMVSFARQDGHPVAGIIDTVLDKLIQARKDGVEGELFLQVDAESIMSADLLAKVVQHDITVVRSLIEAMELAPETEVFSPNAGPHPLTLEVAEYIGRSGIRAVVGAANNVFDTVGGSIAPIATLLQDKGVFVPNDSETNMMGALSVTVQRIDLSEEGLMLAAIGVGSLTELSYAAFKRGIPPQIARDREMKRRFNRLVRDGKARGGPFPDISDFDGEEGSSQEALDQHT